MAEFTTEEGGLSEEVIKKAFEATEDEFLRVVRESWIARPQIASVGSCCLLGAISKGVLYVANLGDSRAVLGRKALEGEVNCGAVVAERLSTDHNVGVRMLERRLKLFTLMIHTLWFALVEFGESRALFRYKYIYPSSIFLFLRFSVQQLFVSIFCLYLCLTSDVN